MDANTGNIYESKEAALADGVAEENIVELDGSEENVKFISDAVRAAHKKKRRTAKLSRKANRK